MTTHREWTPQDWLRLVGLVGGFLLFGVGAWLLVLGIAAEGAIDLKSSVVSGTLKTGSAGLFICFFAFFVIVMSLVSTLTTASGRPGEAGAIRPRTQLLMKLFWGLLLAFAGCILGTVLYQGSGGAFYFGMGLVGMALVSVVFALMNSRSDV